jgi:dihydropyrimidinase
VFLADDATIFRAMSAAGKRGGLICMHAENGIVINEIIKRFLADGRTAPKYHALTRPTIAEAEGVHRAIAIAEMAESPVYIVHLSCTDALNQGRREIAASRRLRRLVRSIYSTPSTITATVGKVRNT